MATLTLDADEMAWRDRFLAENPTATEQADAAIAVVHEQHWLGGCS